MKATSGGEALTELILQIFRVNGQLLAAGETLTKDLGLTSARWQVMGALEMGPATASQIARNMGLKRQSVQRLVDILVKEDILVFEDNPSHRTAKLVRLTELGKDKYEQISKVQTKWVNGLSKGLDAASTIAATQILKEVEGRLS